MILLEDIIYVHERVLKQSGGGSGVRDYSVLESALSRPFQTFDGRDLYPTVLEKAAALLESLIVNHPFVDGNKKNRIYSRQPFPDETRPGDRRR